MRQAILRALDVIGAFLFWNPRAVRLVALVRELVEKFWPEFEALINRTSSRTRAALLRADDQSVMRGAPK